MKKPFSDYSSQNKKVYIELPEFGFYHGPSNSNGKDNRIIGRNHLVKKLKDIIINSDSRTGAYLVTGYRGTGKSSLVNHVVAEVSLPHKLFPHLNQLIFKFIIIIFLGMFWDRLVFFKHDGILHMTDLTFSLLLIIHFAAVLFLALMIYRIKPEYGLNESFARFKEIFFLSRKHKTFYNLGRLYRIPPQIKKDNNSFYVFLLYLGLVISIFIKAVDITLIVLIGNLQVIHSKKQAQQHTRILQSVYFIAFTQFIALTVYYFKWFLTEYSLLEIFIASFILSLVISNIYIFLYSKVSKVYNKYINKWYSKIVKEIIITSPTVFLKNQWKNLGFELGKIEKILDSREKTIMVFLNVLKSITLNTFGPIISFFKKILNSIYSRSRIIPIHINLSYNNLNEKDILQLLTFNIRRHFKERKAKSLGWNFPGRVLLLIMVLILQELPSVQQSRNEIRKLYHIEAIVPSQYDIGKQKELEKKYDDYIKNNDYNYKSMFETIFQKPLPYSKRTSFVTKIRYHILSTVFFTDLFILKRWFKLKSILFSDLITNKHNKISTVFSIINNYLTLNYFPLFGLLTLALILKFSRRRFNILGLNKNFIIEKELDRLYESMQSSTEETKQNDFGVKHSLFNFRISNNRKNYYQVSDARDIEKCLLHILGMIEEIPTYLYHPEFIIIFDELDKVTTPDNDKDSNLFSTLKRHERARQIAVYRFLENLKYFMTTAPAKFIIIAGREMYDSYLADMSDRELNLRNIFNEVIYVNSFLTQPTNSTNNDGNQDITYLTEKYVCQFLMPAYYLKDNIPNLTTYGQYIRTRYTEFRFPTNYDKTQHKEINNIDVISKEHDRIQRQKSEKVLVLLYQFIIYLLHMSNGTPKKIASLFEQFIVKGDKIIQREFIGEEVDYDKYLVAGNNPENFFLVFTPEKQYEIGLISSMMSPIFYSISSVLKNNNDKLLFSTTFILNHLFKFHTSAFSQGNLESSPELTEIYRNPEIRNYINKTIQYLCQTQLEEITGGFYQYKFPKQTALEINYLNRKSELASAAFRFSLDESRIIKALYHKKLELINNNNISNNQISILKAHYYHILGDVSFYEDDLDEAIRCFQLSSGNVEYEKDNSNELQMTIYIRTLMKLGLCYEKTHNFEEAFSIYSIALLDIAKYREVSEESFYAGIAEDDKNNLHFYDDPVPKNITNHLFKKFPKLIDLFDKKTEKTEKLQNLLTTHLTSEKLLHLHKIYFLENNRVFYQPILARLQVQEKDSPDGVTDKDIFQAVEEFSFLMRPADQKEKYMVTASFFQKVGNILYYKNYYYKNKSENLSTFYSLRFYLLSLEIHLDQSALGKKFTNLMLTDINGRKRKKIKKEEKIINNKISKLIIRASKQYIIKAHRNFRPNLLQGMAELLSSIGDICFQKNYKLSANDFIDSIEKLNSLIKIFTNKKVKGDNSLTSVTFDSPFSQALSYYYVSAAYFLRAKKYKQYAFQIQKIMYIINDYLHYSRNELSPEKRNLIKSSLFGDKNNESILDNLFRKAMRANYSAYENVHNMQLEKFKEMLFTPINLNDDIRDRISLKKLTIDVDTEPLTFIYERIRLKTCGTEGNDYLDMFFKNLASPYLIENSMYNKVIKLRYKSQLNFKALEYIGIKESFIPFTNFNIIEFTKALGEITVSNIYLYHKKNNDYDYSNYKVLLLSQINKKLQSDFTINDFFEHLITDSIYCLAEIIEAYNTFGQDNILNHSYIAKVHEDMVYWLMLYRYYIFFLELIQLTILRGDIKYSKKSEPWKRYIKALVNIQKTINDDIKFDSSKELEIETNLNDVLDKYINQIFRTGGIVTKDGFDRNFKGRIVEMKETINSLLKSDSQNSLDPIYHGEQAVMHYYTAGDIHNQGKAYKHLIEKLYHLNDDFNDNLFHFRLAQERYRISTGWLDNRKKQIDNFLKYTKLYDQEAYTWTVIY